LSPLQSVKAAVREKWVYAAASVLLLIPCFWQSRLQAGDLSSHIYNAWLAQLIETGRAQGLTMARQTTNVLFDLLLAAFLKWFGAEVAQRLAVSLAVLTFLWGAFAFMTKVAGRRPWHLMPCLAMLAYGWVFHMGFFNFYLSLGLSLWALAVTWEFKTRQLTLATPLLVLAWVAHALPVIWIGGVLAFLSLARRVSPWRRVLLCAGSIATLALVHLAIASTMITRWSPVQLTVATGLDQLWVFDAKYYVVLMGLAGVWGILFLGLIRTQGPRQVLFGIPFQLCVVSAATVFILPGTILIPGFSHSLSYIAERMSLGIGVCVCAMLGAVRPRGLERWAVAVVSVIFFGFIYTDERALNSLEDRMQKVISTLPSGNRVVSPIWDFDMRVNALTHMVDRVCINHCFSFGNYEPSTGQFRIRASEGNGIVADKFADSWHIQTGEYIVRSRDLPLYKLHLDKDGRMFIEALKAGSQCGSSFSKTLPDLLPIS
jgi:hypothetical protein